VKFSKEVRFCTSIMINTIENSITSSNKFLLFNYLGKKLVS